VTEPWYAALGYRGTIIDFFDYDPTDPPGGLFIDLKEGTMLCTAGTGIGERNSFEIRELGTDDRGRQVVALRVLAPFQAPAGTSTWVRTYPPTGNLPGGRLMLGYSPDPTEADTYRIHWLNDDRSVFALRTFQGRYVTAEQDGNGSPLVVDRDVIGEWQRFMFLEIPEGLAPLPPARPNEQDKSDSIADRVRGSVRDAGPHQGVALDAGPKPGDAHSSIRDKFGGP
jgi:hypothetical protein